MGFVLVIILTEMTAELKYQMTDSDDAFSLFNKDGDGKTNVAEFGAVMKSFRMVDFR